MPKVRIYLVKDHVNPGFHHLTDADLEQVAACGQELLCKDKTQPGYWLVVNRKTGYGDYLNESQAHHWCTKKRRRIPAELQDALLLAGILANLDVATIRKGVDFMLRQSGVIPTLMLAAQAREREKQKVRKRKRNGEE